MADNEKFRNRLSWAERAFNIDVVALAGKAGLSRKDFEDSLDFFYGGDESQYGHILELWDEANYR